MLVTYAGLGTLGMCCCTCVPPPQCSLFPMSGIVPWQCCRWLSWVMSLNQSGQAAGSRSNATQVQQGLHQPRYNPSAATQATLHHTFSSEPVLSGHPTSNQSSAHTSFGRLGGIPAVGRCSREVARLSTSHKTDHLKPASCADGAPMLTF